MELLPFRLIMDVWLHLPHACQDLSAFAAKVYKLLAFKLQRRRSEMSAVKGRLSVAHNGYLGRGVPDNFLICKCDYIHKKSFLNFNTLTKLINIHHCAVKHQIGLKY